MTNAPTTSCRRHGFATLTALTLITLVGAALLALTMLFRADVSRSTHHRVETQLRQLLIAGGAATMQAVGSADPEPDGSQTIKPPVDLDNAQLSVTYARVDRDTLQATITARVDEYNSEQVMRFELSESRWHLAETSIVRHF